MKNRISALLISKNNQDTIEKTLVSLRKLTNDIVVIDGISKDKTILIAKKYAKKVLVKEFNDIGKQRAYGLKYVTGDWVLILDSDEVVSKSLVKEIKAKLKDTENKVTAYEIPFQNHYLGKKLKYGGENYRMQRLFRKGSFEIKPSVIHNYFILKNGKVGKLKGKIYHYSYRSLSQIYNKFTNYAIQTARIKEETTEKSSLKKIFLYPLHMFYSRFIKDKGYKDGLFRIPLDLGFAYMEFMTYLLLALKKGI